jgi:hypothetical protein
MSVREGFGDGGLEFAQAVFGQCEGGAEFGDGHEKILKDGLRRMRDECGNAAGETVREFFP